MQPYLLDNAQENRVLDGVLGAEKINLQVNP